MRMRNKIHDDNHKNDFFICRTRTEHLNLSEKISKNSRAYFHFSKKNARYGPKCCSKATYDLKRALIKHPSSQLSNMNNGYSETRGNDTKWSCQNQIKSKPNSNQKSNPKQDFKLKPVSNSFSGYLRVNLLWDRNC